jgi:hypothetical protein
MQRVYLDLNKWIDLSRAVAGKPGGERFRTAATMIRAAVERADTTAWIDSRQSKASSSKTAVSSAGGDVPGAKARDR